MSKAVRLIGFWDGPEAVDGWPDVCAFVAAVDADLQARVAGYLRSGTKFAAAAGVSVCRLCGVGNGSGELTDGVNFVWPQGLAHYIEQHGVRLPGAVADIAGRGVAAAVDLEWFETAVLESGEISIDTLWWRAQTGAGGARHLLGCRQCPTVASWDLPAYADIYLDRVPSDAVAILVDLRRLLGAAWPFSELRQLLRIQPVHAGTGDPADLYRALSAAPHLRPYVFYDASGNLTPGWSST